MSWSKQPSAPQKQTKEALRFMRHGSYVLSFIVLASQPTWMTSNNPTDAYAAVFFKSTQAGRIVLIQAYDSSFDFRMVCPKHVQ